MINLYKDLDTEKKGVKASKWNDNPNDTTKNLYITYLRLLNDKEDFNDLSFLLEKIESIKTKLKKYKFYTRKTVLLIINRILNLPFVEETQNDIFNLDKAKIEYKKLLDEVLDEFKKMDMNDRSKRQIDNWMTLDEIRKKYKNLYQEFKNKISNKNESNPTLSMKEYHELLTLIMLSILVSDNDTPPRRQKDYFEMFIVTNDDSLKKMINDNNKNICNLLTNQFIFNNYKTKKIFGQTIIEVPEDTTKLLSVYITIHQYLNNVDFDKPQKLFLKFDGSPYSNDQIMYDLLSKFFGKKIGTQMLRNIFASYENSEIKKEKKKILSKSKELAEKMGTSSSTIDNIYTKNL